MVHVSFKTNTIADIRKCWADQDYVLGPGIQQTMTHLLVPGAVLLQTGSDLGEKTPSSEPQPKTDEGFISSSEST